MSGYNYAPPPPPPAVPAPQGRQQAGYNQHGGGRYQGHNASRGGAASRGRGGGYSAVARPEYQTQPPYDYGGHGQQAYASQVSGYHNQPHPVAGAYPPTHQHWAQEPPANVQPQPQPQHQPHAPAPLSSTNYHPNFAPQAYTQSQVPPQQHPYGPPPPPPQQHSQYHYPAAAPYNPQPQPQWVGHSQDRSQPQYGGGQGRGGYGNERGGVSRAGASARADYGTHGVQAPQVSGGYAPPFADPRATASYHPQPHYTHFTPSPSGPPHMATQSREPYHKQNGYNPGRGRGGFRGGGGSRGKPHHGGDKMRPKHQGNRPDLPSGVHKSDVNSSGKKKKRKTNTLGLTPGQDSESEDDEGEEDSLSKLIGQDALQITDIALYIAERKKNFPTADRVQAKKSAEVARGCDEKRATALEKEEKMAIKLRKQLEKVESSIKRKREQQDEGDDMRGSSPPSEVSSDDDEPEAMSSRPQQASSSVLADKKADISKHCKYFSTGGTCGKKGKCRFVHDPEVRQAAMKEREANNGQLTIQQRLILNDKDQEDLTVLQSIQYLREKGLIHSTTHGDTADASPDPTPGNDTMKQSPQQASAGSLPAAPASLPKPLKQRDHGLPPHTPPPSALQIAKSGGKVQYGSWNLSGYGGSGLKSEDLP